MTTPGLDAASIFTGRQDAPAEVAQFEPDFDGSWDPAQPAADTEGADDPQWIVWSDAAEETAWASSELTEWWAAAAITGRHD